MSACRGARYCRSRRRCTRTLEWCILIFVCALSSATSATFFASWIATSCQERQMCMGCMRASSDSKLRASMESTGETGDGPCLGREPYAAYFVSAVLSWSSDAVVYVRVQSPIWSALFGRKARAAFARSRGGYTAHAKSTWSVGESLHCERLLSSCLPSPLHPARRAYLLAVSWSLSSHESCLRTIFRISSHPRIPSHHFGVGNVSNLASGFRCRNPSWLH